MSNTKTKPFERIPPEVNGVQVNFCKNPLCTNFGIPASQKPQPRGRSTSGKEKDSYTIIGSSANVPFLKCKKCGETPTIKSNLGITEELHRLSKYLWSHKAQLTCPNLDCENSLYHLMLNPGKYRSIGKTTAGNPRFRCMKCGKNFTVKHPSNPIRKQTVHSHKNKAIFNDLVNKMPFRGISNKHGISMKTVYDKISFFHRQCLAFACCRERDFSSIAFRKLHIAVDRQDYRLNWSDTNDKRNVVLHGLASADDYSGYIFGIHLDYDPEADSEFVVKDAEENDDYALKPPFRKYARLWLPGDLPYGKKPVRIEEYSDKVPIFDQVEDVYSETESRPDVEIAPEVYSTRKMPVSGMLVHTEYTLYAHFLFLKRMLGKASKIIFYLDQESGIRAACHAAFWEDIINKRVEAFYVKIDKTLTIHAKKRLVAQVGKELKGYVEKNPELEEASIYSIRQLFIEQQLTHRTKIGPWKDEWLAYPFPDMSEPKKAVCWLTDIGDKSYTNFELAKLFLRATLHSVDRFFMQLRRKTSLLERPISTASSDRRTWHAYDPYRPDVVAKIVEIYRVYYNYIKTGEDGKTPAMRLGVAKSPYKIENILYFKENPKNIFF